MAEADLAAPKPGQSETNDTAVQGLQDTVKEINRRLDVLARDVALKRREDDVQRREADVQRREYTIRHKDRDAKDDDDWVHHDRRRRARRRDDTDSDSEREHRAAKALSLEECEDEKRTAKSARNTEMLAATAPDPATIHTGLITSIASGLQPQGFGSLHIAHVGCRSVLLLLLCRLPSRAAA
jgi:hypothetical protein